VAGNEHPDQQSSSWPLVLLGAAIPLALLAVVVTVFLRTDLGIGRAPAPIEDIAVERVLFGDEEISLYVRNVGADTSYIAIVTINEAIWDHSIVPGRELKRFETAEIILPFAWEEGMPYSFTLLLQSGVKIEHTVDIATWTPTVTPTYLAKFALLGVYAGVIPVFLGILWFPFLRRIRPSALNGLLAFTIGLLVFLAVDSLAEALEIAERLPDAYHGQGLVAVGLFGALVLLLALGRRPGGKALSPLGLAYLIAFGIGLHNLGEGLAIGAAYTLGEVALGNFLVVGFTLHNATEGLAIVTPILRARAGAIHLLAVGAIAGVPTIFGTWIGAFTYSDVFSALFLAIGAGAIVQVCYAVGTHLMRGEDALTWPNVLGFLIGLGVMYGTSLLVV
jgi:zinc transporter ZupT